MTMIRRLVGFLQVGSLERRMVLAAAGLFVLALLMVSGWWLRGYLAVRRELARIRAAGEPVTAAELDQTYADAPEDEDATALYLEAFRLLATPALRTALDGTTVDAPPFEADWSALPTVEASLDQLVEPLWLLHEAADRSGAVRYPVTFKPVTLKANLPHLEPLNVAARLLAKVAQVRARRGDARGAAASIRAIFALATSLENEPILISYFTAMNCDQIAQRQIERLLPAVPFSDADLVRFQEELRAIRPWRGVHRALLAERVSGLEIFDDPSHIQLPRAARWGGLISRNGDRLAYLRLMRRSIEVAKQAGAQASQREDQIERDFNATVRPGLLRIPRNSITSLTFSTYTLHNASRYTAWNRVTDAAIAVERFRRRHGRLPEGPAELIPGFLPAVPVDPFDGKPLRYVIRKDECLVYSIDLDQTDDGGKEDASGRAGSDVVLRLRIPAPVNAER